MESPFYFGSPIPSTLHKDLFHGFEEERRHLHAGINKRGISRIGLLGDSKAGKTSLLFGFRDPPNRVHLDCGKILPANLAATYAALGQALGQSLPGPPWTGTPAAVYPSLPVPRKGAEGLLVLENAHELARIDPDLLEELPLLSVRLPFPMVLTGPAAPLRPHIEVGIELRPFTEASVAEFLRGRFAAAGMDVDDAALAVAYEFTAGRPESVQRLGHAVWSILRLGGRRRVTAEDVEAALTDLIDRLPSASLEAWTALRGLMRDLFVTMCLHDLTSPTEIAKRVGHEPKNVIVLLGRLESIHGLIARTSRGVYQVKDPLLKHYVRKEWSSPIVR